jgi:exosortase/archaeosortase family protein
MCADAPVVVDNQSIWLYWQREPALIVLCVTTAVLYLDYALTSALINIKPALCCGFLLALLGRHLSSNRAFTQCAGAPPIKLWHGLLFILSHLAVIGTAWKLSKMGIAYDRNLAPPAYIVAARYLIIVPTILLLPWEAWCRFDRLYRAEWMSAVIALLTFNPGRLFATAWPWYSSALAHFVYALANPFVSGLQYDGMSFATLSGPALDTTITFDCGGLRIIELFQFLFGLILIVDWNELNRRRALVGYFAGLVMILLANASRIALLVIVGNSVSVDLVMSQHVSASWLFIAIALVGYVLVAYPWMLSDAHLGIAGVQDVPGTAV